MLPQVAIGRHCCAQSTELTNYRPFVGDELIDEIAALSKDLKGLRLCHVNATATGGGVAELLVRMLPIYRALEINADWRLIFGDTEFFTVTKGLHNALQGGVFHVSSSIAAEYLDHNRQALEALDAVYDVIIVHDPQPAAMRHFSQRDATKWIWRCHIDSSQPYAEAWQFLRPFVNAYDAIVFTMSQFCPPDVDRDKVVFIPPAIDPLSTKNMELPQEMCRRVIADAGVSLRAPILLQVSRFDPWKDPLGVIRAYRLVKQSRPDVQLVLIGAMAGDDPEGWQILETINAQALSDPDLYVFTNLMGVGNMEVNAFQRGANLIIQKSLREGFGLVVSEALWKEKPIVAGAAGGIPMQYPVGFEQYLVHDVEQCAERLLYLLDHSDAAAQFGRAGRERVRHDFLLPRLVRDELRLIRKVVAT